MHISLLSVLFCHLTCLFINFCIIPVSWNITFKLNNFMFTKQLPINNIGYQFTPGFHLLSNAEIIMLKYISKKKTNVFFFFHFLRKRKLKCSWFHWKYLKWKIMNERFSFSIFWPMSSFLQTRVNRMILVNNKQFVINKFVKKKWYNNSAKITARSITCFKRALLLVSLLYSIMTCFFSFFKKKKYLLFVI